MFLARHNILCFKYDVEKDGRARLPKPELVQAASGHEHYFVAWHYSKSVKSKQLDRGA